MKIALVHDYLITYGGAERVLEALHEVWPKAPVYTSFFSKKSLGVSAKRFENWDIRTTWFDKLPFKERLVSPLRFLAPWVWKYLDLSKYDLVISSAAWFVTKGLVKKYNTRCCTEICYCHTPPRYLYGYQTSRNWRKYWPIRVYGTIVNHFLRQYDYWQAQKVDYFVANSKETQSRIKKFYRREAKVVYPPVETDKIVSKDWRQGDYYLYVGKLSEAKRPDLAIKACQEMGKKLKIVGDGPWLDYLMDLSGGETEFLGRLPDESLWQVYKNARAFLYSAVEEDFGIVPVEAMAAGKPVVAYKSGGVEETVLSGKTGIFYDELTVDSMKKAIKKLEGSKIKTQDCVSRAKVFSKDRFKKQIISFVKKLEINY